MTHSVCRHREAAAVMPVSPAAGFTFWHMVQAAREFTENAGAR